MSSVRSVRYLPGLYRLVAQRGSAGYDALATYEPLQGRYMCRRRSRLNEENLPLTQRFRAGLDHWRARRLLLRASLGMNLHALTRGNSSRRLPEFAAAALHRCAQRAAGGGEEHEHYAHEDQHQDDHGRCALRRAHPVTMCCMVSCTLGSGAFAICCFTSPLLHGLLKLSAASASGEGRGGDDGIHQKLNGARSAPSLMPIPGVITVGPALAGGRDSRHRRHPHPQVTAE